jgi:hypothetical protein
MNRIIIGLMGFARSGKGTVADVLVKRHGFVRMKFADGLKNMLRAIGLTDREIEGDLKEAPCALLGGKTPRHAMITLGTEWGRDMIHQDLWPMIAERRIQKYMAERVVFDDCRFLNEVAMIRRHGGLIWRVHRPGTGPVRQHPSELEQLEVEPDLNLVNNGTIEELQESVSTCFAELYKSEILEPVNERFEDRDSSAPLTLLSDSIVRM